MELDIGGRGSGKTTRVLEWMVAAPSGVTRVAVCHTSTAAMALLYAARNRGLVPIPLESWQFIGIEELSSYRPYPMVNGYKLFEFCVDNLDLAFQDLFPQFQFTRATLTDQSLEDYPHAERR